MKESGNEHFRRLLVEHLTYIEKQCRNACRSDRVAGLHGAQWVPGTGYSVSAISAVAVDPDVLYVSILNLLEANDYKVLREFNGTSKLTTYLTTVISHHLIDLIRKEKGRSRAKQRAKLLGQTGELVYELVYGRGHSIGETHETLKIVHEIECSEKDIQSILDKINRARTSANSGVETTQNALGSATGDPLSILDSRPGPEQAVANEQTTRMMNTLIREVLDNLDGEDLLILRLRHPEGERKPISIAEIGRMLGKSEKAVDKKIRKILIRCRERLLEKGCRSDDFL
jgi:RNA polymerase sigma factor (sigma-70 family)